MKVRFDKEDRKYFTIAEAPIVSTIIKDMKTSEDTIEDDIRIAMQALDVYDVIQILRTDAKISHNGRIWNYYNNESGTIDILVNAIVQTYDEFYIIDFFLSDAWTLGIENHAEIASHICVRKFKEVE
ncbi:MAG: hypothetical protein LUH21_04125 [Clostridiales bacterium]|nr:hypothetical protein [Clostridiales bacterium]